MRKVQLTLRARLSVMKTGTLKRIMREGINREAKCMAYGLLIERGRLR